MPEALELSPNMSVDFWTMILESVPVEEANWNWGNVIGIGAAVIGIPGACVAAITWLLALGGRRQKIDDLLKATEDFPEWKTRVETRLSGIQKKVDRILERFRQQPQPQFIRLSSPLSLTEVGSKVAETIDAYNWAKNMASELREKTSGMSPYEVQEYCTRYCLFEYTPDEPYLNTLRQCAYENGVPLDGVLQVLGVVLRDEILQS